MECLRLAKSNFIFPPNSRILLSFEYLWSCIILSRVLIARSFKVFYRSVPLQQQQQQQQQHQQQQQQ
jgi:hypothetical protein